MTAVRTTAAAAQGIAASARDTVIDTKDTVVGYAESAVAQTTATVHGAALSVRDTAADVTETAVGYAEGTVKTAMYAYAAAKVAGVVVAVITAPVPTLVGLAILWMFEDHARSVRTGIAEGVDRRKAGRTRERALTLLGSYGAIPSTAVIETDGLKMVLDSTTGAVTGTIRTGMFSMRELPSLSVSEIEGLVASSNGDTAKVLSSYLGYRKTLAV